MDDLSFAGENCFCFSLWDPPVPYINLCASCFSYSTMHYNTSFGKNQGTPHFLPPHKSKSILCYKFASMDADETLEEVGT